MRAQGAGMDGRRAGVRSAGILTMVAVLVLGAPAASHAALGDPDLAVVVTNSTARTRTLKAGDRDFDRLWAAVEPLYTRTERVPDAWVDGRLPNPPLTSVLWGVSGVGGWPRTPSAPLTDVAMVRLDQVFVTDDGTPWVRSDLAPHVDDDDIRWHKAPRLEFEELRRDGLLAIPAPPPTGSGRDGAAPAWRPAARGAVLGAAVTLLAVRLFRRRRRAYGDAEPRQELIDL